VVGITTTPYAVGCLDVVVILANFIKFYRLLISVCFLDPKVGASTVPCVREKLSIGLVESSVFPITHTSFDFHTDSSVPPELLIHPRVAAAHKQIMISHVPIEAVMPVSPFVVHSVSAAKVPFLIIAIVASSEEEVVVAHVMIPAPPSVSAIPQDDSVVFIEFPVAVISHLVIVPVAISHPDVPTV